MNEIFFLGTTFFKQGKSLKYVVIAELYVRS